MSGLVEVSGEDLELLEDREIPLSQNLSRHSAASAAAIRPLESTLMSDRSPHPSNSAASTAASESFKSTLARHEQVEKDRETKPFIGAKLNDKSKDESVDEDDDNKEDEAPRTASSAATAAYGDDDTAAADQEVLLDEYTVTQFETLVNLSAVVNECAKIRIFLEELMQINDKINKSKEEQSRQAKAQSAAEKAKFQAASEAATSCRGDVEDREEIIDNLRRELSDTEGNIYELTNKISEIGKTLEQLGDKLFTLNDEIDRITREQEALKQIIRDESIRYGALEQKTRQKQQQEDEVNDEELTDEASEILQLEDKLLQLQEESRLLNISQIKKVYESGEYSQKKDEL